MRAKTIDDVMSDLAMTPQVMRRMACLKTIIQKYIKGRAPYILRAGMPVIRFGVISDLHFGSLYEDNEALSAFYGECRRRKIRAILMAGDVLDGHKIYRTQEFECHAHGLDAQVERFVSHAPRINGIETHFITGNHDTSFTAQAGIRIGHLLAQKRSDWHFLGEDVGQVVFRTGKITYRVELRHPGSHTAYAISYHPQKIVESLEGGTKPDMLCIGHYHKAEWLPMYRNVSVIQCGCFQRQTPFMASRSLQAHVGGWIIEVRPHHRAHQVKAEFISFYG